MDLRPTACRRDRVRAMYVVVVVVVEERRCREMSRRPPVDYRSLPPVTLVVVVGLHVDWQRRSLLRLLRTVLLLLLQLLRLLVVVVVVPDLLSIDRERSSRVVVVLREGQGQAGVVVG